MIVEKNWLMATQKIEHDVPKSATLVPESWAELLDMIVSLLLLLLAEKRRKLSVFIYTPLNQ